MAVDSVIASGVYRVYSTCGNLTTVRGGTPIYQTPVVLDPGHGGNRDIGSQGRNGPPEKVLNLQIAFEVQRILGERGIGAVLPVADPERSLVLVDERGLLLAVLELGA